MKKVIYKSNNFENRKLKFYNHCKKWSAKIPFVSKEMEYDLVSDKFEFGFMELFKYQLNADDVFLLIQCDMEDIFKKAKHIRNSGKKLGPIRCDESRKFLNKSLPKYFDNLFDKEFTAVESIEIPFINDIRFEILNYVA